MTKNLFHYGGIAGQALAKKSNTDYDVDWVNLGTQNITDPNTDLNNYTEDGTYFFNNANTPANKPNSVLAGYLEVIRRNANDIMQTWHCYGNTSDTYTRQKYTETWSNWEQLQVGINYMTVALASDYTIKETGANEMLATTKVLTASGTKLKQNSGGAIVIGKGVNHIRVSGQIYFYQGTLNNLKKRIYLCEHRTKNNT